MNKYFLLIAGSNYYPRSGIGNWLGTYSSLEEAESQVKIVSRDSELDFITAGVQINGILYDWFEIIDLRYWIDK